MYSISEILDRISTLEGSLYEYERKLSRANDRLECGEYHDRNDLLQSIDDYESRIDDINRELSTLRDELEVSRSDSFDDDEVFF